MIMKKIYIANIIMLAACSSLFSQTTPPDTSKVVKLNEVVVSATREEMKLKQMPASISIIDEQQINTMSKTIAADEVMRLVPGVKIDNGTSGSRVHLYIRGQGVLSETGFRGIQVLLDGIPINQPGGYCPDLYDVDWGTVKRVEVVKGLAASMYGGSGAGGVVNIVTQDGGEKPFNNLFYASAGSDGFWKILEQVDGTKDNLNYRYSYSHLRGNGYRIHQAYMGDNFSSKLNWTPSQSIKITQLLTYTRYFNQNSEGINIERYNNIGPTAANPDAIPYNEFHLTQRLTGATTASMDITKNQNIVLSGFFRMNNYRETSNNGDDHKPYLNPGTTAQYNLNFGKENLLNHVSLGADFQSQVITEHEFAVPDGEHINRNREDSHFSMQCFDLDSLLINQIIKQQSLGVFLMDKLDISKKLYVTANVRYDYFHSQLDNNIPTPDSINYAGKKNFENVTYRFGVAYDLCKNANIYANYGTGFLIPTNDELYNNPITWGGYNSTIEPTKSQGGEVGIRGNAFDKLNYDITGFMIDAKNGFYRFSIPGRGNNTAFFGNRDESKWGAEVYASYSPIQPLNIQIAYTYSHFQYKKHDSVSAHWIPECPQHILAGEVSYKINKNFKLTVGVEYQSKWYIQVDDSIYNQFTGENGVKHNSWYKGYTIVDAGLVYNFKVGKFDSELSLYAKNIFNEKYFGFIEPNNWDPVVPYNSYQPAPGNEFFINFKVRF